ncbi:MAG: 30S ribosomal protein S12 methylthiotransferase RimO [Actinobacteria bacterium]|nr:30S ribosomal protein S12 methylthiotransferase RimO [Actinomycetota bacterium]
MGGTNGDATDAPARTYFLKTLGCPKNQVDSDKLEGTLAAEGMSPVGSAAEADLVVVNTCAFIDAAREESIETVLAASREKAGDAQLVVTGCLAERFGDELAAALPEVDQVAGFGVPLTLSRTRDRGRVPSFDLLNLPRPPSRSPWAYVKVAEGCDRACGFCAIPSFRGKQRSRTFESIMEEVDSLGAKEVVLVAQDLASYGRDLGRLAVGVGGPPPHSDEGLPEEPGTRDIVGLVEAVSARTRRTRLLYLYPSDLTDRLVDAICATGVPYFDLSLQHVSRPLLRRMRRWGGGERFMERITTIRAREPEAALRSSFIVGYPGETEDDHDQLLRFVEQAQLDWASFFRFSPEDGTYAIGLDGTVDPSLMDERLNELSEMQDSITRSRRGALVGERMEVLVDRPGEGRSYREAPEIDGVVKLPASLEQGSFADVVVTAAAGPDLEAAGPEAMAAKLGAYCLQKG